MFSKAYCRRGVSAAFALSLATVLLGGAPAVADNSYPAHPVRIIVPSAAGGGTDITARMIAQELTKSTGQSFFVENRPGAGQMIGITSVAQSNPDGLTLLMAASTLAINPVMYKKLSYDVFTDFIPVTQVVSLPNLLVVNARVPAKTLAEFIDLAKKNPGKLTYASAGIGTSPHMSMELLKSLAGIDIMHVPYKGTTPGVNDLLAGTVDAMMVNVMTAAPHIEAGTLRVLGVTGRERLPSFPAVAPIAEQGLPDYEALNWYGLLVPAKTPAAIVQKLHRAVSDVLRREEVKKHLLIDGALPVGNTPDQFAARIKADIDKWAAIAKIAGIKPN